MAVPTLAVICWLHGFLVLAPIEILCMHEKKYLTIVSFAQALEKQPTLEVLGNPLVTYAAYALLAAGGILVITRY